MPPAPGDTRSIQTALATLGWPIRVTGVNDAMTHQAISDFQDAYTYMDLLVDGWAGIQTCLCLEYARLHGIAPHFRAAEFKSHGNGWIKADRELVRCLEVLRSVHYPRGLVLVSAYRDPYYNDHVIHGASNSQHKYGNAVDVPGVATVAQVRRLQRFSGIGYNRSTGKVVHVDVRHRGPNTTGGQPWAPTVWEYAR